jgi:hypothetical protein
VIERVQCARQSPLLVLRIGRTLHIGHEYLCLAQRIGGLRHRSGALKRTALGARRRARRQDDVRAPEFRAASARKDEERGFLIIFGLFKYYNLGPAVADFLSAIPHFLYNALTAIPDFLFGVLKGILVLSGSSGYSPGRQHSRFSRFANSYFSRFGISTEAKRRGRG